MVVEDDGRGGWPVVSRDSDGGRLDSERRPFFDGLTKQQIPGAHAENWGFLVHPTCYTWSMNLGILYKKKEDLIQGQDLLAFASLDQLIHLESGHHQYLPTLY